MENITEKATKAQIIEASVEALDFHIARAARIKQDRNALAVILLVGAVIHFVF